MTTLTDAIRLGGLLDTILFENDRVRVLDVRMTPGQSSAQHAHRDGVWYVLAPMKAHFTNADGSSAEAEIPVQCGARPKCTPSTTSELPTFGPSRSN